MLNNLSFQRQVLVKNVKSLTRPFNYTVNNTSLLVRAEMETLKEIVGCATLGLETLLHRLASQSSPFGITVAGMPLEILVGAAAALLAGVSRRNRVVY